MSEEVCRLNILRHIAQLSKRLPHCREPSLNQSCSSIYNAHYLGYYLRILELFFSYNSFLNIYELFFLCSNCRSQIWLIYFNLLQFNNYFYYYSIQIIFFLKKFDYLMPNSITIDVNLRYQFLYLLISYLLVLFTLSHKIK